VRVLIVEDNNINQKVLTRVLDRYIPGCKYSVANNGQEAVEELTSTMMDDKAAQYDIILMDCMMVLLPPLLPSPTTQHNATQHNTTQHNTIHTTFSTSFSHAFKIYVADNGWV